MTFWEWPPHNELWARADVQQLMAVLGGRYVDVSSAALGQRFVQSPQGGGQSPQGGVPKAIKKKWRVATVCEEFIECMAPFTAVPDLPAEDFTWCRGKIAKESGRYPEKFAQLF